MVTGVIPRKQLINHISTPDEPQHPTMFEVMPALREDTLVYPNKERGTGYPQPVGKLINSNNFTGG